MFLGLTIVGKCEDNTRLSIEDLPEQNENLLEKKLKSHGTEEMKYQNMVLPSETGTEEMNMFF